MKAFLFLFLTCISLTAVSQSFTTLSDSERDLFKRKLAEYNVENSSIKGDFTQEKNLSILENKVTSKGKFYFKKENKIRWEVTSPNPYVVYIDGSSMKIKENDSIKSYDMSANKIFKEIHSTFVGCLQGNIVENSAKYSLEYFSNGTSYMLKLIPSDKKMKGYVSEVQIVLNQSTLNVEKITIKEPSGDFTDIKFTGTVLNATISDSTFKP